MGKRDRKMWRASNEYRRRLAEGVKREVREGRSEEGGEKREERKIIAFRSETRSVSQALAAARK